MKTTIRTIILASAALFAAMSCQKETAGTQDLVKEGETIQVSINAGLGGFVAADATKTTATPVVRLEWAEGDKVDAYYGATKISGTDRISVEPSDNKIFAKLSGTIDASGHTIDDDDIITFVYSNVTGTDLTFDFSSQGATIPFVAYATVKWSEIKSGLSDKILEFKFATSVMKIAATGLDGSEISSATIDGINTKVALTPQTNSEPVTIEGNTPGTINKTAGFDTSSDKTRAIFTVGLVPDNNTSRKLKINGKEAALTSSAIEGSKSYTTPSCTFEEAEFVVIGGKKWATKNLGADKVGDYGKLYSWGNLAGQRGNGTFDPPFGDPNYPSTLGAQISSQADWKTTKHDAAYNEWGGSWRMPTKQDFSDLAAAGVWIWTSSYNSTGKAGYIVYVAQDENDKGIANMNGTWKKWNGSLYVSCSAITERTYSENTVEHIFFPAAGISSGASGTSRDSGGSSGSYRSSTLSSSSSESAHYLSFGSSYVSPQTSNYRFFGMSVRPVSD